MPLGYIEYHFCPLRDSLVAQMVKNLPAMQETQVRSWVGKIPWRRQWQPTPVFLPYKSNGQRNLAGYSPWHLKELDTTEQLMFLLSLDLWSFIIEVNL